MELGGRFGYFLFFFCSGRGKGESEARRGGGDPFFIENPRRGGGGFQEGPRGREGVCGELGNFPVLLSLGVFVSLVFFLLKISLVFWVFSAYFPRFLGGSQGEKILDGFEDFLGIFEKTKEKKDRVGGGGGLKYFFSGPKRHQGKFE